MCARSRYRNGNCEAERFDAATAEAALLAHLDSVFVDLDGLVAGAVEKHSQERGLIEGEAAPG